MKRLNPWLVACAALLLAPVGPSAARAEGKSVDEKILDILLQDGTIDQKKHDQLLDEVHKEKQSAAGLPAVSAPAEPNPEGWKVYWKEGTRIERNDGLYKIKLGGRIQYDFAASSVEHSLQQMFPGSEGTGTEVRRARLFMEGELGEHGIFKAQYDFVGGKVHFKDVYAGLRNIPFVGTVRAGHFYEPQSIEMTTSSKYITFLERGLPVEAFTADRQAGIGFDNHLFDDRMTVHVGGYRKVDAYGNGFGSQGNYDVGARVTALPVWEDGGRRLVHTGLWYSHQFRHNEMLQYEAGESHTVGSLLNMPEIPIDGVDLFGGELAAVCGPFSAQSEIIASLVDGHGTGDRQFYGSYLSASWFLTGENKAYDRKFGVIGRTHPKAPFSIDKGQWGALELAGRWSYLTLNDGPVRGGIMNDFTLGLNWYLYSNLRLMTNYVLAHRNGVGDAHVFQTRVSLDF